MRKTSYHPVRGQKFGEWVIIDPTPIWTKGGYVHFLCQCSCGVGRSVSASNLYREVSTNCGCIRRRFPAHNYKGVGSLSGKYYRSLERGAIVRGLEFTITIEELYHLFDGFCALSGKVITLYREPALQTASADRIDSSKGYVLGNVQWVHKDVNEIKKDFDQAYFIQICKEVACNNK